MKNKKMRYSIEPRDLLSFAKNMGKNLSNKWSKTS